MADEPNLGLATTEELIEEIKARIDVDYIMGGGGLQYTSVHGRPGSRNATKENN